MDLLRTVTPAMRGQSLGTDEATVAGSTSPGATFFPLYVSQQLLCPT
jgi:hypothetical protein